MDEAAVTRYIVETFDGSVTAAEWGDLFFFYNPDQTLPKDIYFATLKTSDDDYDHASNLDRPGVYRLNIGVSKETFLALFGQKPQKLGAGDGSDIGGDFTVLDQLLPHPVYASMGWVCILNPGDETFRHTVQPLLAEAYAVAVGKFAKRARQGSQVAEP